MDVNTNIWGTQEEWRDATSYTYYSLGDFKRPKEGVNSYYNAYQNGSLVGGEVPTDLSLAFWGIGKGSILTHPMFLASYWDGDTIKTAAEPINEEDISNVPCILGYASNGEGQYTLSWWNRYAPVDNPGEAEWTTGSVINIWAMYNEIFTSFNYQKIILVPFVRIALGTPTDNWGESYVSLKDYIDGMTAGGAYVNHNKILSIGYQVAVGDGSSNRSTGNKELSINIPVNIKGSSRHWEGVKSNHQRNWLWFATEYGINTMLDSGMLNPGSYSYARSISPYRRFDAVDFSSLHNIGDSETGLCYKYCENYKEPDDTQYNSVPIPYYYDPDNEIWKINDSLPWNNNYAHPFPYIECTTANKNEVRDYILKQIAYLGFPFVYDPTLATRGKIGDIGVYLPKFDETGVTTGEYAEGAAALILPNAEWVDGRTGSGYDPYAPPPSPDQEDFGYLINPFNSNRFTTGLNVWCMYQQDILDVLAGINNLYLTDPAGNEKWQLDFKGSNPDDYIVSCKAMLLDVAHSETTSAFKLGPVQFDGIACYKYSGTGSFSFGTIPLDGTGDYTPYGDFRDYQPYTTMELYIPLCGTVEIDPEFFVGHNMEIIMMYDIYTGACTAGIYRDNFTLWKAVNGQIGADIPVSAMQMGTYQNAIHSLQAAQKQNEIRLASSAVTVAAGAAALIAAPATGGTSLIAGAGLISGAAGLLSGVMQEQNYDYQIEHTQPIPAQTTAAETQNNFCVGGLYPILYVKRAKMLKGYDAEIYSHTIGNACLINDQVGSQSGLVMCTSVDLSGVPATVEEINAIKQALGKGVYV